MRPASFVIACGVAATASFATLDGALAQSDPAYVRLGRVNAARFVPDEGPAPHIAFVSAHRTANTIGSSTCTELAQRGFMAICFETRFRNDDIGIQWEELPHDVKAVVDHARAQPPVLRHRSVVLPRHGVHVLEVARDVVDEERVVVLREIEMREAEALTQQRRFLGAGVGDLRVGEPGLGLRDH